MPTYSKRGKKPRVRSRGSKEKPAKGSQMAMNRKITRDVYKAREIEQSAPARADTIADNKSKMDSYQSTLKPIRSSQS